MGRYSEVMDALRAHPRQWLVTGAAGFIGSNLVEHLLKLGQRVVGLDDFSTGHRHNVDDVSDVVGEQADAYRFVEGSILDPEICREACEGVDVVLHQAALGSVPRSLQDPLRTHLSNVDGFLNVLIAARDAEVPRFVYAASSSTYGDHPALPKVEDRIGQPLSPYAVTKLVNELYASVFARNYGMECIGLRYFNVFGRRQDPEGAYAAVIPAWIGNLLAGRDCFINGDGESSRDFCYVDNVLQANVLAATTASPDAVNQVFNVAFGERTTLNQLFDLIRDGIAETYPERRDAAPVHRDFRTGDIRHSHADISKIRDRLGYAPEFSLQEGMTETVQWYVHKELERRALTGA